MPSNCHPTPWGQFILLQNWPEEGLHGAQGVPVAAFCLPKLCMLQQEHLNLIIFTLIIFGPPPQTHTHARTHSLLTFEAPQAVTDSRGSGWSRALGSRSVFSFVYPAPLTRLFLDFLSISCLFLFFHPHFSFFLLLLLLLFFVRPEPRLHSQTIFFFFFF